VYARQAEQHDVPSRSCSDFWNILQIEIHRQSPLTRDPYILIRALRCAFDAKHRVAPLQQSPRHWIQVLFRNRVSHLAGAGLCCERKSDPLADEGDVPGVEDAKSVPLQTLEIPKDLRRIAIGSRPVGSGHKHNKGFRYVHTTSTKPRYLNRA